jgi:hypothetical protein
VDDVLSRLIMVGAMSTPRLRVRELAEARGLTLASFQREAKLPVSTARRYWYNSRTGLPGDAGTLSEVSLFTLGVIAALLEVRPGDLFEDCGPVGNDG